MLRSPYPPKKTSTLRTFILMQGWAIAVIIAPWVLVFPPRSYEGLGLAASIGWGVFTGVGAAMVLVGQIARSYMIELPGIIFAAVGLAIYCYLAIWQTFGEGVLGSGARALIVYLLLSIVVARGMDLWAHHRELRRVDQIARR